MISICGRPLIEHQLDWLKAGGVSDAVILCGYKAEVLQEHLGDGGQFAVRIIEFSEKPLLPHWINAGVYIFSPEIFSLLPERGDHEDTTFPRLSAQGTIFGYKSKAFWRAIDTLKDLREAERELEQLARR